MGIAVFPLAEGVGLVAADQHTPAGGDGAAVVCCGKLQDVGTRRGKADGGFQGRGIAESRRARAGHQRPLVGDAGGDGGSEEKLGGGAGQHDRIGNGAGDGDGGQRRADDGAVVDEIGRQRAAPRAEIERAVVGEGAADGKDVIAGDADGAVVGEIADNGAGRGEGAAGLDGDIAGDRAEVLQGGGVFHRDVAAGDGAAEHERAGAHGGRAAVGVGSAQRPDAGAHLVDGGDGSGVLFLDIAGEGGVGVESADAPGEHVVGSCRALQAGCRDARQLAEIEGEAGGGKRVDVIQIAVAHADGRIAEAEGVGDTQIAEHVDFSGKLRPVAVKVGAHVGTVNRECPAAS